jgi:SAM-dependent methyltransferase
MDLICKVYACPACKGKLEPAGQNAIRCTGCHQQYDIMDGIPVFAPLLIDQFYEQRIWTTDMSLSPKAPLKEKILSWLINTFYLAQRRKNYIKKMLKGKKGLVLDVGCGGGKQLYHAVGPVLGIDICMNGLKKARQVYSSVAQADVLSLPFQDNLFDCVVSTDLIEHVPVLQKEKLFAEMWRVLKSGGILVHEIETLSDNALYRFARKDIDLFFKYFIVEISGHFGLETAEELLARFGRLGAEKINVEIIFDACWPLNEYLRLFGEGYRQKYGRVALAIKGIRIINNSFIARFMVEAIIGTLAKFIERFRPLRYAKDLGVCYRKP